MQRTACSLAFGLVIAGLGCAGEKAPGPAATQPAAPPTNPEVHVAAKPNDAVQFQVVKYEQVFDAIQSQKGKIVVVLSVSRASPG